MSAEEKLDFLQAKLQDWIDEKEQELREAAHVLQSDLGALSMRLDKTPRKANLSDIKTGMVYATQTKRDALVQVLELLDGLKDS